MNKTYFCDPVLNVDCTKEGCFLRDGPCYCTTNTEFAMKNQNGKPVECLDTVDDGPKKTGKLEDWLGRFQFKNDWDNEFK